MTITDTNDFDAITWTRASDQFGTIENNNGVDDARYVPTDVTIETLNGVTYMVSTWGDGDVQLHRVTEDVDGNAVFTMLGEYQGGSAPDDESSGGAGFAYSSPTITLQGDTLIITAAGEQDEIYGFTYDTTQADPTTVAESQDPARLDFRGDFLASQNLVYGGVYNELEKFTLSNGEEYYIQIDSSGNMASFQVVYDEATDTMTFEENFGPDVTAFNNDFPYDGGRLVRTDTLDENASNIIIQGTNDTTFQQVGDVIYGHSVGPNGLVTTKWELDDKGNMTGAQVVYTDGTTTKDLADLGITDVADYPATSPFDPTATTISSFSLAEEGNENDFLQAISGVDRGADLSDGSLDVIDFGYMRSVDTFEVNGDIFMAVSTWSGSEDGFAVFKVDPATGLPTEMTGFVEADIGSGLDGDDVVVTDISDYGDVQIQQMASGEYVLTYASGDGLTTFQFDPTKSSLQNGQGSLSFIGYDKGSVAAGGNYGTDTDAGGSPVQYDSGQSVYDVLPTGQVITSDLSGFWVGNTDVTVPICFVSGTMILTDNGPKPVEDLEQGDLVHTKDNGLKPIRWVGRTTHSNLSHKFLPVRVRAGALGVGMPEKDLYVSQQHRILVKSKIAVRMMAFDEVLIPANKLLEIEGIDIVEDYGHVTYVHFLFDQHEIVFANGAEAESLFTGPEAMKIVPKESHEEILALFPELTELNYEDLVGARIIPSGKIAKKLVSRIKKNNKPLYEVRH